MAERQRQAIDKLITSRSAYKGWVTKSRTRLLNAYTAYTEGEDPALLEKYLDQYKSSFEKYKQVDEEISLAEGSDLGDMGKDYDQLLEELFRTEVEMQGYRRDFDKAQLPDPPAAVQDNNNNQNRRSKIDHRKPERLKEETDLKDFLRWKPTWTNYATLIDLAQLNREKQVGIFWDCCTPGFLNTWSRII